MIISTFTSISPSVDLSASVFPSIWKLVSIPVAVSQNVINEVFCYVLRMKNIHFRWPPDSWGLKGNEGRPRGLTLKFIKYKNFDDKGKDIVPLLPYLPLPPTWCWARQSQGTYNGVSKTILQCRHQTIVSTSTSRLYLLF